jgi:hypothetical protein
VHRQRVPFFLEDRCLCFIHTPVWETRIRGAVGDLADLVPVRHACLVSFFWHA